MKQVQRLGELISSQLPVKADIEWTYKVGLKADKLNFIIKKG